MVKFDLDHLIPRIEIENGTGCLEMSHVIGLHRISSSIETFLFGHKKGVRNVFCFIPLSGLGVPLQ